MDSTRTQHEIFVSVFLAQLSAKSEGEAQKKFEEAQDKDDYLGGRLIPPNRQRKREWLIQACYEDDGGRPPQGMARLQIPANSELSDAYGLTGTDG